MLAGNPEHKTINKKSEMPSKPTQISHLFPAIEEQIRLIQTYEMLCRKAKRLRGGQLR